MEHGHDVQRAVRLAGIKGEGNGKGVQDDGPVGVDHALGVTRGGRGVADHGRVPLGEVCGEVVFLGELCYELVVHDEVLHAGDRFPARVREHDDMPYVLELVFDHLHEDQEVFVHEEHLVFGVVDDVDEVVLGQPEVHRVKDRAVAGHPEIELQVPVVVERHAGHLVSPLDPE
jgi:hypothetical protein